MVENTLVFDQVMTDIIAIASMRQIFGGVMFCLRITDWLSSTAGKVGSKHRQSASLHD